MWFVSSVKRVVICWVLLMGAHCALGMTLIAQGHTLYASGPVYDDYRSFIEALDKGGIERIVFVNSPGGDLWTGMRVGRLIADKAINTVVAGTCVSACSIMFMGGKARTFTDNFRPAFTYVGIHGPHRKDTLQVVHEQAGQIFAFFKAQMGERFNAEVVNKALYDMEDAGALLKVFDAYRYPRLVSYHCKSEQTARRDCTEYKGQDAFSLGVVTSVDLTSIELPDALVVKSRIFGQDLTDVIADTNAFYIDLSARQCSSDNCKNVFKEFATYRENKALAIPLHDTGYGMANNNDTALTSHFSALYYCNHIMDKPPRLCETQVVNGFDVRNQLYVQGDLSHVTAMEALRVPADKYYGNEEYGGGFTDASRLRVQKVHDITPQKVDGVQTIGTQALSAQLKSAEPPILVDVWAGSGEAIPSSLTLLAGGQAFEDAATDNAYEARFTGLLKLLSPDIAKPVVFYCMSRDCWLSANAAMRAHKVGYTNVYWYRGGMASWKAAGLPTAAVVVRAVVQ